MNLIFSQVLDYQNCLAMDRLSGLRYNIIIMMMLILLQHSQQWRKLFEYLGLKFVVSEISCLHVTYFLCQKS